MSPTVSDTAQQPRLVVDRYGTMDMVSINFVLPPGALKGARGRDIADELLVYIADKGLGNGHVTHHHPDNWAGGVPGAGSGPYGQ